MDEDIIMTNDNNSFIKKKKIERRNIMTQAEARIKNDLTELNNKRLTTGKYEIKIFPYFKEEENENNFIMYVEFQNYFKIKIKFLEEYPFVPPLITYESGKYYDNLFDMENNLRLNCLNIEKWSPVLDLNTILFSIELKMDDNGSLDVSKEFYRKRKFYEYKNIFNDEDNNLFSMEEKLKKLKI